ncbi:MAG: hypothetical protein J7M34_08565 [Anaerolineae bacterium]|nr:hypothetical protein [Anaerolineae bacterium]
MRNLIAHLRDWQPYIFLAGAALFLLLGIISLIAYFIMSRQTAIVYGWRDPVEEVDSDRVRPDLALLPLAGVSSETAAREALSAGEPDTAFTILMYAADLDEATRGGLFELVGERFVQARRLEKASLCFQLAHDLAALSPDITDMARFDLSLSAARGRLAVGDRVGLDLSLEQAETLIRYSAHMQPAQRQRALNLFTQVVAEARGERKAAAIRAELRKFTMLQPRPELYHFSLASFAEPLPLNPDLERLRLERQQRALALVNQWIALNGGDVGPERADLAEFLRREEQARVAWYADLSRPGVLSPGQRVTLLAEQISWLLVRLQAARGAFGIELVPEWEGNEEALRDALTAAQEEMFALIWQQTADLGDQRRADQVELMLVRMELADWRVGHYPGLDPEDRDRALTAAVERVRGQLPGGGAAPGSGVWPMPRLTDDRRDYVLVGGPSSTRD